MSRKGRLELVLITATTGTFLLLSLTSRRLPSVNEIRWCDDIRWQDDLIADRLTDRRERIYSACSKYGNIERNLSAASQAVDVVVDSVVWRPVPNTGSNHFFHIFLRKWRDDPGYQCESSWSCFTEFSAWAAYYSGDKRAEVRSIMEREIPLGEGGSVIVVRDPFSRLVSVYQEEVREQDNVRRWVLGEAGKTDGVPTFPDFIDYVIKYANGSSYLDRQAFNSHWMPQEAQARLCSGDFQYILQLETLDDEIDFVLRALGLSEYAAVPIGTRHRGPDVDAEEYIKQLSDNQLDDLYEIFRLDIILFNA